MTRTLHIAREGIGVDIDAAQRAAADFLAALGIDVDREDLRETPARMAQAIVRGGRVVDAGQLADASVPLEEFAG